ncbi:MAG TPA: AMP-binding protein, partial [Kribbellaceae bacterium]
MADTGETLTYAQLEERSVRLARMLYDAGLRPGDDLALLAENGLRTFEVFWAAMRSGLYLTAINHHLKPSEISYVLNDCEARALVASSAFAPVASSIAGATQGIRLRLVLGDGIDGFASYEDALATASSEPLADQPRGKDMLYSSGTTGLPKGVKAPLPGIQVTEGGDPLLGVFGPQYGLDADTVYLSPAPLYHAAPL